MCLHDYLEDNINIERVKDEPQIDSTHLSTDEDLIKFNGPYRNYENEIFGPPDLADFFV